MMPYQEVHTLYVEGTDVDMTGVTMRVTRPGYGLDVVYTVTKKVAVEDGVQIYEMVPVLEPDSRGFRHG